ncbi:MAG: methyltransferase domain-containing protein [Planctomycetota bacterium]
MSASPSTSAGSASPVLDYYREHGIIPVDQRVELKLGEHFGRRDDLLRQIGLPPGWLAGKSIIEFGPGTGQNARHLASLSPARLTLIDGNAASVEASRASLSASALPAERWAVVEREFEHVDPDPSYDLVLCEGVTNIQDDPAALIRHLGRFAAAGGVVVTTCVDAVSFFPENLRRLMGRTLDDPTAPLDERVRRLMPVFQPHLDSLRGMSRRPEDWLLDVVLAPRLGGFVSMDRAIDLLAEQGFEAHGMSPRFWRDGRWYKAIGGDWNDHARASVLRSAHNLLDYRADAPDRDAAANLDLRARCERAWRIVEGVDEEDAPEDPREAARRRLERVTPLLASLRDDVAGWSAATAASIDSFLTASAPVIRGGDWLAAPEFAAWFGRGQQYVALAKVAEHGERDG